MVASARRDSSLRAVAREFGVTLSTVQRWVGRAEGQRLDRVDWSDRARVPHRTQRTPQEKEDQVLAVRRELRDESVLGEYGAPAIYGEMLARGIVPPSIRTIGRILVRRGALERRRRVRHRAPPPGWYLPAVAAAQAELDSFDVVEGLKIQHGPVIAVLTGISLHGKLPGAWPTLGVTAEVAATTLVTHWQAVGLPHYAQFDNATVFQGAHQHRDSIGRVMRICLSLGVVPVFAPPREHGFQAAIESFNGRWQAKVWARFHHTDLRSVTEHSDRYTAALRKRAVSRSAPERRAVPSSWTPDVRQQPQGTLIFLRRTSEQGSVYLLGHRLAVDKQWPHRLVRAEVDLGAAEIRFYALRRRQPDDQPLLNRVPYSFPRRPFQG